MVGQLSRWAPPVGVLVSFTGARKSWPLPTGKRISGA
jgi:hypothetical protein